MIGNTLNPTRTIFICLLSLVLVSSVFGFQNQGGDNDKDLLLAGLVDENSLFVPAPRESLRPMLRAEKAINNREYSKAVALLGEILSESGNEDFLVRDTTRDGSFVSLRKRSNDLLGLVPAKHRELYELRYGIQAKHQLEKAIEDYDFFQMSQIMNRYFYTRAGFDATMLVGHFHLDNGRPIAAAFCFEKIVSLPEALAIHDPEASFLLAICWMLTGDENRAVEVLQDLKARSPKGKISFQGKDVPLFARDDQARQWLKKLIGDSPLWSNRKVREWVMYGGNPQRNANSGSGFPLLNPVWSVPTLNDPSVEKLLKEHLQDLILSGASTVPAIHPIAVGDSVIMRTHDQMIGVDFRTGRRVWSFPSLETDLLNDDSSHDVDELAKVNRDAVRQRLFEDSVYGQMSSDGKTVFAVPTPGFAGSKRFWMTMRGGRRIQHPLANRFYNELIAVDISRQGAFKWEVGGKDGLMEPKLAETLFLGPPLPIGDELYAICEQASEIRLVVLEAETGKLKWMQQLAVADTRKKSVSRNSTLRLAGAAPSFSDGILVCPTGHGAIVAIDVATRSLLWGFQYVSARAGSQRISPLANSKQRDREPKWKDAPIKLADGAVIYTPVDRRELVCLDLASGRPLWTKEKSLPWIQREESLFVGAVDKQRLLLVELDSMRAVDMRTGEIAWRVDTAKYGHPSGRGYSNDGFYFQPTTFAKLIQVNMQTGEVIKSIKTDGVLGNLVCYRGSVISHGVDRVSVFPDSITSSRKLKAAEARGEIDPELLSVKAQLLMQDGKLREAAEAISAAFQDDPTQAKKTILADLMITLIEKDYEFGDKFAEKFESNFTSLRPRFQSARIDGLIRSGEQAKAFNRILDLIVPIANAEEPSYLQNLNDEPFAPSTTDKKLGIYPGVLSIRFDQWLRSRIDYLVRLAPDGNRGGFIKRLNKVAQSSSFDSVSARFRAFNMIGEQYLNTSLLKEYEGKFAENDLQFTLSDLDDIKTKAIKSSNLKLKKFVRPSRKLDSWKHGMVVSEVRPFTKPEDDPLYTTRRKVIKVIENDNDFYNKFQFRHYYNSTGQLEIIDQFGGLVCRLSTRDAAINKPPPTTYHVQGTAKISGHAMVVTIGTELFVVDLSKALVNDKGLLWSHDISEKANPSFRTSRPINIWGERDYKSRSSTIAPVIAGPPSASGVCYLQDSRLVCADLTTGKTLWQRTSIEGDGLLGDDRHVIVWDSMTRLASVFEKQSGHFLKELRLSVDLGAAWEFRGNAILFSGTDSVEVDPKDASKENLEMSEQDGLPIFKRLKVMTLFDVGLEKSVWSRTYDEATVACRVRNDKICALVPNGNLEFIDFVTGEVESSTLLGLPESELRRASTLSVSEVEGAYLVKVHCSQFRAYRHENSSNVRLTSGSGLLFWNGYVTCVDRETRQVNWKHPARVQFVNFMPNQPYSAPLLLMFRRLENFYVPRTERYWSQFMAIDLRDGRVVANDKTSYSNTSDIRVEIDPDSNLLALFTTTKEVRYYLTDETPPPRPVALVTSDNSISFSNSRYSENFKPIPMADKQRQDLLLQLKQYGEQLPGRRAKMKRMLDEASK